MVRSGDRVYGTPTPDGRVVYWAYHDLDWWARASTGSDYAGHATVARSNDGKLMVTHHGPAGQTTTWFTLDELNHVGGHWDDGDVVAAWCLRVDQRAGDAG